MALHPPSGPEGYLTTFKDIGSQIAVYDEFVAGNLAAQGKLVASVQQLDYDFQTVKSITSYVNNTVAASQNLDTAVVNSINAVSNYLTVVTAPDIGSTATTASGVLADLIWNMRGATTGTPSGLFVLLSGHFYNFAWDNYGIVMPAASGAVVIDVHESRMIFSGTLPSTRRIILDSYGD